MYSRWQMEGEGGGRVVVKKMELKKEETMEVVSLD